MTPGHLIGLSTILVAVAAIVVTVMRASAVDRRDTLRLQLQEELAKRDVTIANLSGQLTALKETIESFARAFVDRRYHE